MTKEFVSSLRSFMELRESLKVKLRDLSNLKTQETYSDVTIIDNVKQSVSSSRLQIKIYEDIEQATEKFQKIQQELISRAHEVAVQLCDMEKEESTATLDLGCARAICHGIQQQSLLELCLAENLVTENLDNDVLVTITQCFSQEIYLESSQIRDVLEGKL